MRKILAATLALMMLVGTTTSFAASEFMDIKSTNWAYSYVNKLTQEGGIKGYPDGTFKPQNTITVAEFVKTVVALIDGEIPPLQSDSNWASGYMLDATVLGIIPDGMFNKEDWDKPISRQKMGVIMERTAELCYKEDTVTDQTKLNSIIKGIKDYDSICEYCKKYIVQASARGLITGYSDGSFKPENTATRAEATAMVVRLIDKSFRVTEESKMEGTPINITDYTSSKVLANRVIIYGEQAVFISDGSRFNLSYGTTYNDKLYTLKYNDVGRIYGIMSNGEGRSLAQHVPTNIYAEVLCDGKISDFKYLVMVSDDKLYIFPNPFI